MGDGERTMGRGWTDGSVRRMKRLKAKEMGEYFGTFGFEKNSGGLSEEATKRTDPKRLLTDLGIGSSSR